MLRSSDSGATKDALSEKSVRARKNYEEEYTETANVKALIKIYEAALAVKKNGRIKA